jgi:hypothetical protein
MAPAEAGVNDQYVYKDGYTVAGYPVSTIEILFTVAITGVAVCDGVCVRVLVCVEVAVPVCELVCEEVEV